MAELIHLFIESHAERPLGLGGMRRGELRKWALRMGALRMGVLRMGALRR